jgi:hypothetical protein
MGQPFNRIRPEAAPRRSDKTVCQQALLFHSFDWARHWDPRPAFGQRFQKRFAPGRRSNAAFLLQPTARELLQFYNLLVNQQRIFALNTGMKAHAQAFLLTKIFRLLAYDS